MTISLQHKHFVKPCCPFIKWVSGKRGLISQMLPLFPRDFNNYHEPFFGWWRSILNFIAEDF